ncbi:MAG: hypothetical protein M0Z99_20775 [Betaproteobacteria bacterium]|nr:hypothetical protein [Betaproteobacteria bacterium]
MNTIRFPSPTAKAAPIGTRCERPSWFERRTATEYQALYAERGINAIHPEMVSDAERLQRALLRADAPPRNRATRVDAAIGWACFAGILVMVALLALRLL